MQQIQLTGDINEGAAREFLSSQKFPAGLQELFIRSINKFPIRYIICDDSGSMACDDGAKIVGSGPTQKVISCSRWDELTTALKFHVQLARMANAPTEFRMLNGAQPLMLGNAGGGGDEQAAYTTMMQVLKESPSGGTPLCFHIRQIVASIKSIADGLRANRQRACVIIATDGESSDGDIAVAMAELKSLPVWVVIRLCTNDDRVVNYWNNIDAQLELEMDVLDDFGSEAAELKQKNPWMTYGLPIHRLREFGLHVKEFDVLDENKLTLEGMMRVCDIIYGDKAKAFPDGRIDVDKYSKALTEANKTTPKTFSPVYKKEMDWIMPGKVTSHYGKNKCSIC